MPKVALHGQQSTVRSSASAGVQKLTASDSLAHCAAQAYGKQCTYAARVCSGFLAALHASLQKSPSCIFVLASVVIWGRHLARADITAMQTQLHCIHIRAGLAIAKTSFIKVAPENKTHTGIDSDARRLE